MKTIARLFAAILLTVFLVSTASAQGLPQAKTPEEVGLSAERLKRLSTHLQKDVDQGVIPGAVVLIVRQGKVAHFEAVGFQDKEGKVPMARESIFRVASMTKPFISLAVMMLAEEGKIQLLYPVSRYLPEFKDLMVGVPKKDEATGKVELALEPAKREVTVQDLLRHTSGLTYGIFGKSLVKDRYLAANVLDGKQTNAELVTKLSKLPLHYQPGTTFDYSMSIDVLGRIVEVVSGVDLDAFVAERITKPLKLADTGFWAESPQQQARIAQPSADPSTGKRPPVFDLKSRPPWLSGGGGMCSTPLDYARFLQMFLNGGTLDGVRLVSRKTVEHMTANHLPPGTQYAPGTVALLGAGSPMPEMGQGFGLGFAVRTDPGLNALPGSVGDFSWSGYFGTYFWVDPKEKLIAVLMTQATPPRLHYRYLMRHYVYQAIVD